MARHKIEDEANTFGQWLQDEKGVSPSTRFTYVSTLRFLFELLGKPSSTSGTLLDWEPPEEAMQAAWDTLVSEYPRRSAPARRVWDLYAAWTAKKLKPFPRKSAPRGVPLAPLPACVIDLLGVLRRMGYSKSFIASLTAGQVKEERVHGIGSTDYAFPRPGHTGHFLSSGEYH